MNHVLCIECFTDFFFLQGFIRNEQFNPKKWIIPGEGHRFHGHNQTSCLAPTNVYNRGSRHIKSKVIADCVEALIGAYLTSAGELAAFKFLEWIGMKIGFHKETVVERSLFPRVEKYINLKALEALLKYNFNNPSLLLEALTHGSYQVPDTPRCYQVFLFCCHSF